MTTSPTIAEARERLEAAVELADSYGITTLHISIATARALLAETRGDEGFSSLGANAPSSGTEQASEPAVTSICSAEQYDGTASASHTSHHSREPAGEMVERVATAIYNHAASSPAGQPAWADCGDEMQEWFRDHARAAIAAMAEPTIEMFCAGDAEILSHLNDHSRIVKPEPTPAQSCWRAMIDAALSPGGKT